MVPRVPKRRPTSSEGGSRTGRTREPTVSPSIAAVERPCTHRAHETSTGLRQKVKDSGAGQKLRPFEIRCWRLDEHNVDFHRETSPASVGPSTTDISHQSIHTCTETSASTAEHGVIPRISRLTAHRRPSSNPDSQPSTFPLSSDHLLHLIQHNVFRAFMTNKTAINTPTGDRTNCYTSGLYRHDANLHQTLDTNVPPSLAPTTLQQNRYHDFWIKVIPFPRIRDNLIRNEGLFDHWDLMHDLVGDIVNALPAVCTGATKPLSTTNRRPPLLTLPPAKSIIDADEDEVTSERKGLIVWGEPHDTQSWEVTPGFLAKWAWVMEGCEELVEISNHWRTRRGEEPMQFPDVYYQ